LAASWGSSIEGLACLGEELTDLVFNLESFIYLRQQLARVLMTRELEEYLLHLALCIEEIALVETLHCIDDQDIDRLCGWRLELTDNVRQVNLLGTRAQLLPQVGGWVERGVETQHELETDHCLFALAVLEFGHGLSKSCHDPFLGFGGKLGIAWVNHDL